MPDVFISYRREDTSGYAGRLYDQISVRFGAEHVFMDVTTIEPGSDFVEVIEQKVSACDALIALIGKTWLTSRDEQNRVRLGRSEDFVSVEITAALKRNVEGCSPSGRRRENATSTGTAGITAAISPAPGGRSQ